MFIKKKLLKNGFITRNLILLNKGKEKCKIQIYECKHCGKTFNTDLTGFIDENKNITKLLLEKILKLFVIYGSSIYKIHYYLKQEYNIEIPHQSIENTHNKL
ncbi:hypothetical protein [Methanosphaera sp. WGK6]|uniref:hypothetical protein n=1 Tax=Methanosphaera sp. WGK6 TaxID=1561964 RepID=UPI00084C4112|nr:hypothetical protein [Methanosphaera sp. WGK6]OED30800.1 hypothetical protein NL43_00320 [Methanosphaera sp. WGK6]